MSPAAIESTLPESMSLKSSSLSGEKHQFPNLRGVRWRINLGILPSSSSIDDIRRVTANFRRRYLLINWFFFFSFFGGSAFLDLLGVSEISCRRSRSVGLLFCRCVFP